MQGVNNFNKKRRGKDKRKNLRQRQKKTKMVAWFVSNCKAKNNRLNYAKKLSKHIQVNSRIHLPHIFLKIKYW